MSTETTDPTRADLGDTFASRVANRLTTLLLLAAIALALFQIGNAVVGLARGRSVTFQGSVDARATDTRLPSFVDQPGVTDVTVHIHHASTKQQLLVLVRDLTPTLMFVAGLWLLRGLLVGVRRGDPFNNRSVRRLRWIAALLIAVPLVGIGQHYIDNALAGSVPNLREWPNGGDVSLNGFAGGLVVLVLAQVFAHGVRLREDVEGTI